MRLVHIYPKSAFIYEAGSTMQHRNKDQRVKSIKLKTNSLQLQPHHHNPPQKQSKKHVKFQYVYWKKEGQFHFQVPHLHSGKQKRSTSQDILDPDPILQKAHCYILDPSGMQGEGWSAHKQDPQLSANPTCFASQNE